MIMDRLDRGHVVGGLRVSYLYDPGQGKAYLETMDSGSPAAAWSVKRSHSLARLLVWDLLLF
jgi:hypothetical protein